MGEFLVVSAAVSAKPTRAAARHAAASTADQRTDRASVVE